MVGVESVGYGNKIGTDSNKKWCFLKVQVPSVKAVNQVTGHKVLKSPKAISPVLTGSLFVRDHAKDIPKFHENANSIITFCLV